MPALAGCGSLAQSRAAVLLWQGCVPLQQQGRRLCGTAGGFSAVSFMAAPAVFPADAFSLYYKKERSRTLTNDSCFSIIKYWTKVFIKGGVGESGSLLMNFFLQKLSFFEDTAYISELGKGFFVC